MTSAPASRSSRPLHLHPRFIALVALGGVVGTGLREGISLAAPTSAGAFPFTIFAINIVGAFALGALLESLTRTGPDVGWRRDVRLGVGTGVIGGFTTYSAFAGDTALLLASDSPGLAVLYALGTVALGAVATSLGILVAGLGRSVDTGPEEAE